MIKQTLIDFFSNHPQKSLLIAYSGGIDSQVLLHCLGSLKTQHAINSDIRVCHVNHGLSVNAVKWQAFAKAQCQLFGLPLDIIEVNVQAVAQKSLEALARDARYQALKSVAKAGDLIVTGHHSDDQAETFLLALKRGAGLKGLSAMQSEMMLGQQLLVRPLLTISRADIEAYAKEYGLVWIEDESNTDERFDRNFLRHQILPKLNQRWPSINKTIARSAEHCFEAQQLLDELAQQDLIACQSSANKLSVVDLNKLSEARLKNLLRYFLSCHGFLMPSQKQLMQICQQLNAQADKSPVVQLAECCIRRYQGELHLTGIYQDLSLWQQNLALALLADDKPLDVCLPDQLGWLSFSNLSAQVQENSDWQSVIKKPAEQQKVTISFSHENPRCLPQYRQHSRPLKKVLQELAIPTWQRKRLPFIFYDNELVAVVGQFVCQRYLAENSDSAFTLSWHGQLPL
ncbi:tRNA lysidine(34) synthetase TilS [Colwellia sp. BRX8-9]|uniref:tRNA lysidine(34) synthetase TilS n=1 Tax=Colwellia sp. BRX8-9 TaxID=2759831 RepID=UPI0015F53569|nr:tRNA lysidine(34) synthetase TilS [Colwellia sp. BRX8-9]MBA6347138.1 tRNA lysidine(34) synthetase TilS [Colwellia sp. BRX8-9]